MGTNYKSKIDELYKQGGGASGGASQGSAPDDAINYIDMIAQLYSQGGGWNSFTAIPGYQRNRANIRQANLEMYKKRLEEVEAEKQAAAMMGKTGTQPERQTFAAETMATAKNAVTAAAADAVTSGTAAVTGKKGKIKRKTAGTTGEKLSPADYMRQQSKAALQEAQDAYDAAAGDREVKWEQARRDLQEAEALLAEKQRMGTNEEVAAAQRAVDEAEARLETWGSGNDTDPLYKTLSEAKQADREVEYLWLLYDTEAIEKGKQRAEEVRAQAEANDTAPLTLDEIFDLSAITGDGGYAVTGQPSKIVTDAGTRTQIRHYARDEQALLPTDEWDELDLNIYYSYLGKGMDEEARAWAADVNRSIADQKRTAQVQGSYDYGKEGGFASGIVGYAQGTLGQAVNTLEYFDKLAESIGRGGLYVGSDEARATDYTNAIMQGKAEHLNEMGTLGNTGKGLGDLYHVGLSISQSLTGRMTGETLLLMNFFGQAANQGFDDAIRRGGSTKQAADYSMLVGLAEVVGEKVSLDHLLKPGRMTFKRVIKQAAIEGLEEGTTGLMDAWADAVVMMDKSKINMRIDELRQQGVPYDEAVRQAWKESATEIAWEMAAGALSGGVSSGGIAMGSAAYHGTQAGIDYIKSAPLRKAGVGSVSNQADAAWAVLTGQRTAEQQQAIEQEYRDKQKERQQEDLQKRLPDLVRSAYGSKGIDLVDDDVRRLTAEFDQDGDVTWQDFVIGTREAYQQGARGMQLQDALATSDYAAKIDDNQFYHAWRMGAENAGKADVAEAESRRRIKDSNAERDEARAAAYKTQIAELDAQIKEAEDNVPLDVDEEAEKARKEKLDDLYEQRRDVQARLEAWGPTETAAERLESDFKMLGEHAAEAAQVYDKAQNRAKYAAAMQRAAALYAAQDMDLKEIVRKARTGERADIVGILNDEQVETAMRIGKQMRAANQQAVKQSAARFAELRQQADALAQKGDGAKLAEVNEALQELRQYGNAEQEAFKRERQALEDMVKADTAAEQTDAYDKAYNAAVQHMQNVERVQKGIEALEKQRAELQKTQEGTVKRKKGTVSYDGGTLNNRTLKAVDRENMTRHQKRTAAMVEAVADAVNIDYVLYDGEATDVQGAYEHGGTIYININAGMATGKSLAAATLSHELTHYLQEYAPTEYQALKDFLVSEVLGQDKAAFDKAVRRQLHLEPGLSYDEAVDEVVANACQKMLWDSKAITKLARQNMTLAEKIADVLESIANRIKEAIEGISTEDLRYRDLVKAVEQEMERAQQLWDDALVAATENYNAEQTVGETQETGGTQVGQYDLQDFEAAEGADGKPLFQIYAMEADEERYREMLTAWGGMSDAEVDELFLAIDTAMDKIMDHLEELDYAWETDIDDRGFKPVKPNSDPLYKISIDFSTLCRKRVLQGAVQNQLQATLDRALSREEGIAIRDALVALQEEGKQIEVACALCYVESARMRSPGQIVKFINHREEVLRDYFAGKDAKATKQRVADAEAAERQRIYEEYKDQGGVRGKGADSTLYDVRDSKKAPLKRLPGKLAERIRAAKKAAKAGYEFTAEQAKIVETAKAMKVTDFTSPEGLENLAKHHREIFDAYTSFIRNATNSKGIENDTWWRAGDSSKVSDLLIEQMNRENGTRTQSWSDFQVKHLMDYIAATIELSTRGAKQHAYTKVIDYVDLMGDTGVMINMSLIPTREFNGKLDYDNVEGFIYKEALRLREKYHATAGTICIGVDNRQIQLLMASDVIDYIIPYHHSGMAKHVRKAMRIPNWTDYQDFQNEKELKGAEARRNAERYGVKLLDESDPLWHKHTKFSDWFDLELARAEAARVGKSGKYGVMTGGYAAMQQAAETYKKICAERGLAPKFSYGRADFSGEENYWKLLIDRKMVDNVTGEVIEQKAIRPKFDINTIDRILNDELERYGRVKADQDEAMRRVTEAFLGEKIKGGMSYEKIRQAMQKPVDNISIVNITQNAAEVKQQAWDENGLDGSAKDGYNIGAKAIENYNHLMEVLGYDTRDSGRRRQSGTPEGERLERIKSTYSESTVRSEKDRNNLCDAVRQAGGIQKRRVNIGPGLQADLNVFGKQFYTSEMLHIDAANKARGISTVFFVDDIVDEYGDRFAVNGFSDPNKKTVYVRYNAKNKNDSSVNHWYRLGGKTVARYEGVHTAAKTSRHERFHQLIDAKDKAALALFRFVDDPKGKYVQYFEAANFWYQRALAQDNYGFSDYSNEIAADLYAGTLIFDDKQIRQEVRRLVSLTDKNNQDTVTPGDVDKSVRFQQWSSEEAEQLGEDVKRFFKNIPVSSDDFLSTEELEDYLDFDSNTGRMYDVEPILESLSNIAQDQSSKRTAIYRMMDGLLERAGSQTIDKWTGENATDTGFAEWYNKLHPDLYYPGYKRGDLNRRRRPTRQSVQQLQRNIAREKAHLEKLLARKTLPAADRAEAQRLLDQLNQTGSDRPYFYQRWMEGQTSLFGDETDQTNMWNDDDEQGLREMEERWGMSGGDMVDFDAAINEMIQRFAEIHEKGGWYSRDITGLSWYKEGYTNFFELLQKDDKAPNYIRYMIRDLNEQNLHDLKWFPAQALSGEQRKALRKYINQFNKLIDERVEQLAAEKGTGRNLGVSSRKEYTLSEIRSLFDSLNSDKETGAIAKKVFDWAESMEKKGYTIPFKFRSIRGAAGQHRGGKVRYDTGTFNDPTISDAEKARVLLHEIIHVYSASIVNLVHAYDESFNPDTLNGRNKTGAAYKALTQDAIDAVHTLDEIHRQIQYDPAFKGADGEMMYGTKNTREMIAELSNPEFRAALKKKSLLQKVVDAVKRLFGFSPSNAYDAVSAAFDRLMQETARPEYQETSRRWFETSEQWAKFQVWDVTEDDTAEESEGREQAYQRLQKENKVLSDTVKALKQLSSKQAKTIGKLQERLRINKTTEARLDDATKFARALLKEHGSRADAAEIAQQLKEIGDYILQTPAAELSEEKIKDMARDVADNIIYEAVAEVQQDETLSDIVKSIKGRKLTIDPAFGGELDGGFAETRKRLYGRITLASSDSTRINRSEYTSVSQFYADLQGEYGEHYFPNLSNEGEELMRIEEMFTLAQPIEVNPYKYYYGETVEELANRIAMDAAHGVLRAEPARYADVEYAKQKARADDLTERIKKLAAENAITKADAVELNRQVQNLQRLLRMADTEYEVLQKKAEQRIAQVREEGAARVLEAKAAEREKAAKDIKKLKEHYREMRERASSRRQNTQTRTKIKKLIADLNRRLAHPTEDKYVPRELMQVTLDVLNMIDMDTGRGSTRVAEKLAEIRAMYEEYKNNPTYSVAYDETVADMLDQLAITIRGTKLKDMGETQLLAVYKTLRSLTHVINTAVKVKIGTDERNAFDLSKEMTEETRDIPKAQKSWLRRNFLPAHLRADVAFNRFAGHKKGSTWGKVARMLNNGQLKQTRLKMELSKPFAAVWADETALADYTGMDALGRIDKSKLVDIGLKDASGNPILVTRDIMVGLYLDLTNEGNRRHFISGGMTIPNLQEYYDGKGGWGAGSQRSQGIAERMSALQHDLNEAKRTGYADWADDLKKQIADLKTEGEEYAAAVQKSIEEQMTDYDRAWVAAIRQLMDVDSKRELNATTMEVYGIEKASVENYWPITTDSDFLSKPMEAVTSDMNLENVGFMKERIDGSNPALALGTVQVVARQIDRVAQYCGMMPALRSFGKIWSKTQSGYKDSLKNAVHDVFQQNGIDYVENLVADLSGGRRAGQDILGLDRLFGKLRGNLAQSTLTLNPRVALAQAASFPTAAAEVGWKALGKALAHGGKNGNIISAADQELIAKWSPLLWYRMQGYSTPELGDIQSSNAPVSRLWRKLRWATGWIQAVDGWTVGRLWYAAEYWVQDNKPDLEKGSDAYYEAVAEKFNDVVEKTQPNYTPMQRAAILREPSSMVKTFTMFMTQRLQNFNIVYDATATYQKARADFANQRNGVTQEDVAEAQQTMLRAVSSQLVQTAVFVGIKTLTDALLRNLKRYKDDDTGDVTAESTAMTILDMYIDAMVGSVIGGSEVYTMLKAMTGHGKWYGLSISGVDTVNDMVESLVNFANAGEDITTPAGRQKLLKKAFDLGSNVAQTLGIPAANAAKIGNAVAGWVRDALTGDLTLTDMERTSKQQQAHDAIEAGVPKRLYTTAVKDANTNGGSLSQDELGEYLSTEVAAGRVTPEQANVIWSVQGWKTDYDAWKESLAKAKAKEEARVESASGAGMTVEQYDALLQAADANGNSSVTQDELGAYLQAEIKAGRITATQAESIWTSRGWKKTWSEWASKH